MPAGRGAAGLVLVIGIADAAVGGVGLWPILPMLTGIKVDPKSLQDTRALRENRLTTISAQLVMLASVFTTAQLKVRPQDAKIH